MGGQVDEASGCSVGVGIRDDCACCVRSADDSLDSVAWGHGFADQDCADDEAAYAFDLGLWRVLGFDDVGHSVGRDGRHNAERGVIGHCAYDSVNGPGSGFGFGFGFCTHASTTAWFVVDVWALNWSKCSIDCGTLGLNANG